MSYILDALRRAEAERSRGAVPGLHSPAPLPGGPVGAGGRPPRRGRVLAVWALLVLALGAGLGWWLRPAAPAAQVATAAPAAQAPLPTSAPPDPSRPGEAGAPAPAAQPVVPPTVVPAAMPASPPAAQPLRPAAAGVAPPPRPRSAPAQPAGRPASPAATPVPHLSALPAELRQSLPPLKLGGAMYSDNAESRVLVLNDQLWHEGEHPAPELLLERIQPHAAQLNFRGQRFQLTY